MTDFGRYGRYPFLFVVVSLYSFVCLSFILGEESDSLHSQFELLLHEGGSGERSKDSGQENRQCEFVPFSKEFP